MHAFLDGATGFIGSHLVREMFDRGWTVTALVRPGSDCRRIADVAGSLRIIRGTLEQPESWLSELLAAPPLLAVQLAWDVTPGRYLESDSNAACAQNALNWLDAVAATGCRRVVMVGTCLEYAAQDRPLVESVPIAPRSRYARCKNDLHDAAVRFAADRDLSLTWCRLFQLYGPAEDPRRLVPSVIRSLLHRQRIALGSGDRICDYLHVADVASAIASLGAVGVSGAFNICSGRPTSVRDIASLIASELGGPDLLDWDRIGPTPNVPRFLCGSNDCLCRATGWLPRWTLESGLRHAIDHWRRESGASAKPMLQNCR